LASEETDAERFSDLDRPQEAIWPAWSDTIREAWSMLRDDRFYGAMGGLSGIYYSSLSRYAHDNDIPIQPFALFVMAMDSEFVAISNEKALVANKTADDD
jgi:hypothetical protein